MDIDGKGSVSIEDVVRFVNVESDQYYRNRDLVLVFRRLSGGVNGNREAKINFMKG